MRGIPVVARIANAAACPCGAYGAAAARARPCGCSRQTVYDQGREILAAVAAFDRRGRGADRDGSSAEPDRLRDENDAPWARVDRRRTKP